MIHRHEWRYVDSLIYELYGRFDGEKEARGHETSVLYRCEKCRKVKTIGLIGYWSPEKLKDSRP